MRRDLENWASSLRPLALLTLSTQAIPNTNKSNECEIESYLFGDT